MKNLKKVCSETKSLGGWGNGVYLQLNFDLETGELFTDEHAGTDSYTRYTDPQIVFCGYLYKPMTMREIKEIVANAVYYYYDDKFDNSIIANDLTDKALSK